MRSLEEGKGLWPTGFSEMGNATVFLCACKQSSNVASRSSTFSDGR
jgi:hypothetical protein